MKIAILIVFIFIKFHTVAQNETKQEFKRNSFGYNLNYLREKVGEVEGGDNLGGMYYTKKQSIELEIFMRHLVIKDFYLKSAFSFAPNSYFNSVNYNYCSFDYGNPCLKLSALVENKILNAKLFLNFGKLFHVNNNTFFIEWGIGRNSILKRTEFIHYEIYENDFNQEKAKEVIEESRYYLPEQLTKLRFRIITGVSFKLLKKYKLNYSFFIENLNYDRYKYSSYKPQLYRFYHNFNLGFGLGFLI